MDVLGKISQWYKLFSKRSDERKQERISYEAEQRFQLREWDGQLFICVDGEPILKGKDTIDDTMDVLFEMRAVYKQYHGYGNG